MQVFFLLRTGVRFWVRLATLSSLLTVNTTSKYNGLLVVSLLGLLRHDPGFGFKAQATVRLNDKPRLKRRGLSFERVIMRVSTFEKGGLRGLR